MLETQEQKGAVQTLNIDLEDVSLEELEQLDDSVLTHALQRLQKESALEADGFTMHSSHSSSWNNSPSCPW
jgi:FXSXX-COOH protein